MKTIATVIGACLIGTCGGYYTFEKAGVHLVSLERATGVELPTLAATAPIEPVATLSGDYLSSLFAQQHHDWKKANDYLVKIMKVTPDESSLMMRAMVLSMGTGDAENAIALAKQNVDSKDKNALSQLFLAVGAFHDKDYKAADGYIKAIPQGSLSDFIMPLLISWTDAANGVYNVSRLNTNTIHLHHAVLISDFLKKDHDTAGQLKKLLATQEVTLEDIERIANLYAHIGEREKAMELYQKVLEQWPDNPTIAGKVAVLQSGKNIETMPGVTSAEEGLAATLYDMSNLLYREYADDSARVFARMALYLMPSMTDARLLLAAVDGRNGRVEESINSYSMIPPSDNYFLDARRKMADLFASSGKTDKAIEELTRLSREHNDLESLIKIGDIYRKQEDFTKAIEVYNEAATKLGPTIPKEYWNLLYVRGISYERAGDWAKAESDLKASLEYQPNHPFVLNYLGYAWADKGINLDQAVTLLQKATQAQPEDGYIADSLGWAYYRMGRFNEGLPSLERAVELLPYDPVINDHLGDAYWQIGRKREARFQWQRAQNFSKDDTLTVTLNEKLANGLTNVPPVIAGEVNPHTLPQASNTTTAIP